MMNIMEITDINSSELDIYYRLPERQLLTINEPAPGIFIAESFKVIERALTAGFKPISALVEKRSLPALEMLLKEKSVPASDFPIYTATGKVLDSMTGYHLTGGCLCAMERRELFSPVDILKSSRRIAFLENIMNPTNVGAIFRSAAALGMDAVLLTRSCSDPLYRRSIRVSMGTVFRIPWAFIDSKNVLWPNDGIELLHENGFKLASMALRNESVDINDPILKSEERLVVALGSEGEGLLPETISKSDYVIKIPMFHDVDSLNVAAASALAFWELGKV
ncbi:MAG: RNA methyltransferase [Butyrivibrio sp.]|nr:RNA methyltransferase [Butyrivibrio sp.]